MRLTHEEIEKALRQVYDVEAVGEGHLSELGLSQATSTAIELMEGGASPRDAFKVALYDPGEARDGSGKWTSGGGSTAQGREDDRNRQAFESEGRFPSHPSEEFVRDTFETEGRTPVTPMAKKSKKEKASFWRDVMKSTPAVKRAKVAGAIAQMEPEERETFRSKLKAVIAKLKGPEVTPEQLRQFTDPFQWLAEHSSIEHVAKIALAYDPNEARDSDGKWTAGPGGAPLHENADRTHAVASGRNRGTHEPENVWVQQPDGTHYNGKEVVSTDDAHKRIEDASAAGNRSMMVDTLPADALDASKWKRFFPTAEQTTGSLMPKRDFLGVGAASAGLLPRDNDGHPTSMTPGAPSPYKGKPMPEHWRGSPQAWEDLQSRSADRYAAAARIPKELKVPEGPEQPGENLVRVTHADTPEIMRARQISATYTEHTPASSSIDTPERNVLRKQIADDLYGAGAAKKERKAVLIMGPPGSGKSTLIKGQNMTSPEGLGAIEIDSDMAKEQLPGFNGGLTAHVVHEESSEIAKGILKRAILAGDNIVHPLIGKSIGDHGSDPEQAGMRELLQMFQANGYTVEVHNVTMDPTASAESVVRRYHQNGRFVPPEYALQSVDGKPSGTYATLEKEFVDNPKVLFHQISSDELIRTMKGGQNV